MPDAYTTRVGSETPPTRQGASDGHSGELPPPDVFDPVIEAYKKDVDRTLLRENLKLTPQQRFEKFEQMMETVFELQRQARRRKQA